MVKINMPVISKAVLIRPALINKRLHLKPDNYSRFHPQVGHSHSLMTLEITWAVKL